MMHLYLDHDLPEQEVMKLKVHLLSCTDCQKEFDQLAHTDALLFSELAVRHDSPAFHVDLTEKIMAKLPPAKRKMGGGRFARWIKYHPGLSVAAMFVLLMGVSLITNMGGDDQVRVSGSGVLSAKVVIEGDKVTIPADVIVPGDLVVENGEVEVLGKVEGKLTLINTQLYEASTAKISGEIKQIDQVFDWIIYKIKSWFVAD
jgi:anti-sigma factor RsiW